MVQINKIGAFINETIIEFAAIFLIILYECLNSSYPIIFGNTNTLLSNLSLKFDLLVFIAVLIVTISMSLVFAYAAYRIYLNIHNIKLFGQYGKEVSYVIVFMVSYLIGIFLPIITTLLIIILFTFIIPRIKDLFNKK
jgi:hypothetical protein